MRVKSAWFRLNLLTFLILVSAGCTLSGNVDRGGYSNVKGDAIVNTARSQMGKPYKWGGCSPKDGFDCSGYVFWVYQQHGINVPRTSSEQAKTGGKVARSSLQPGDIVVFAPKWQSSLHTGIYTGRDRFLHSPKSGSNIREDKLSDKHWSNSFVSGRRLIY